MDISSTLFVSDLDGTLLDNHARVTAESACILSSLVNHGVKFTVATARTPATVEQLLAHTHTTLPVVVMTGAALWHRDSRSYSHIHYIPEDITVMIDSGFANEGIHPFVYVLPEDHRMTVYNDNPNLSDVDREFIDERKGLRLKRFVLGSAAPASTRGHRILYFAMGTPASISAVARHLQDTGCAMSVYSDTYHDDVAIIEIFAPGVSKAEAVVSLKEHIGAKTLVVYGDNMNDLPMMNVADVSVGVMNARSEVLKIVDVVIGANTDDAVARHIAETVAAGQ